MRRILEYRAGLFKARFKANPGFSILFLARVIPLKLYFDMVHSSFTDVTRELRGGSVYASFRFVSKRKKSLTL